MKNVTLTSYENFDQLTVQMKSVMFEINFFADQQI